MLMPVVMSLVGPPPVISVLSDHRPSFKSGSLGTEHGERAAPPLEDGMEKEHEFEMGQLAAEKR